MSSVVSMKRFHAHLYFEPHVAGQTPLEIGAISINAKGCSLFDHVKIFERQVGPHPVPMVEFVFWEKNLDNAIHWLNRFRGDCSVLVHTDTGDDVHDHTIGARWLGDPKPLKFEFFEAVSKDPSKKIHKD